MFLKKIANVSTDTWLEVAAHLGCLGAYIEETHNSRTQMHGDFHLRNELCFSKVAADWGNSEKGTGSMPRNWKTVLDVFRRCAASDKELSELASFEDRLVHGKQY